MSFYISTLTALPRNFHNNIYNGVNIIMLLQDQAEYAVKVPLYATFKQAATLLEEIKDTLPDKSDDFDPDKPLKGITLDHLVVKYLETYKKQGKTISKALFEKRTQGMTAKKIKEAGFSYQKGLKGYKVFPLEKIQHLLPDKFIKERDYFAKQQALEAKVMLPENQDLAFVKKAQLIIDEVGVPVIEKTAIKPITPPKSIALLCRLEKIQL
ncbi:hypothetical protein ATN88_12510 [Enterovibrio coralii]|uniref:Uncharacterized protein n=1 Tax=Enterovibrio coralii TaxID=294935 RepID=A0A135I2S4_9GAMM|nr:hypothetical protein ATN88_12510 [Enterovibrio coralii]